MSLLHTRKQPRAKAAIWGGEEGEELIPTEPRAGHVSFQAGGVQGPSPQRWVPRPRQLNRALCQPHRGRSKVTCLPTVGDTPSAPPLFFFQPQKQYVGKLLAPDAFWLGSKGKKEATCLLVREKENISLEIEKHFSMHPHFLQQKWKRESDRQ